MQTRCEPNGPYLTRVVHCRESSGRRRVQALTKRLQGSLAAMNASAASEVDSLMEAQAKLAQRGADLESAVSAMQVSIPS